jgi:hypothetical protein
MKGGFVITSHDNFPRKGSERQELSTRNDSDFLQEKTYKKNPQSKRKKRKKKMVPPKNKKKDVNTPK